MIPRRAFGHPALRAAGGRLLLTGAGAAGGAVTLRVLTVAARDGRLGGVTRWQRTNHRGEQVTLLEGPACALTLTAAAAAAPAVPVLIRAAALIATAASGAVGAYDDLTGSGADRGLRGHLGALGRGQLTTGAVKVGTIGVAGLAAGALLRAHPLDAVLAGGVVAGTANLVNLLDLRPGRALKAGLLLAVPAAAQWGEVWWGEAWRGGARREGARWGGVRWGGGQVGQAGGQAWRGGPRREGVGWAGGQAWRAGARRTGGQAWRGTAPLAGPRHAGPQRREATTAAALAAAAAGTAAGLLPADLRERAMLGDCGANALGALLGVIAAATASRRGLVLRFGAVSALTLASERISFTKVIESTPLLRELDALGRRPPLRPAAYPA